MTISELFEQLASDGLKALGDTTEQNEEVTE